MSGTAPAPADLGQPGEQVDGAEPVSESYPQFGHTPRPDRSLGHCPRRANTLHQQGATEP